MYAGVPVTVPAWVGPGSSPRSARARPKSRILTRVFLPSPLGGEGGRNLLQPQVGRLDVAVDQTALVGRSQAGGGLAADPQHFVNGQRPLRPAQARLQRLAPQQWHRQERHAVLLGGLVDGDDVVVLDGGDRLGLGEEPLQDAGARHQLRLDDLHGDLAFQARVVGLEDHAHAAGAEQRQDVVRPQPAQFAGLVGGTQEAERRQTGAGPGRLAGVARRQRRQRRRLLRPQALQQRDHRPQQLLVGGVVGRARGAHRPHQPVLGAQRGDGLGTAAAVREVLLDLVGLRAGDQPQEEAFEQRRVGASRDRTHGVSPWCRAVGLAPLSVG
jgi:hypothetical protein